MDLLKKKGQKKPDIIKGLSIKTMKAGFLLDFDLKTWEVTSVNHYDWGGDLTYEWQLKTHDDTLYLEFEDDDEDLFSVSRKIPIGKIDKKIIDQIIKDGDPPEEIQFDGTPYFLDETAGGKFYKDRGEMGKEMVKWDFIDDSGKKYLTIEQWGEADFEASEGYPAYEYQFTNLLPGKL